MEIKQVFADPVGSPIAAFSRRSVKTDENRSTAHASQS